MVGPLTPLLERGVKDRVLSFFRALLHVFLKVWVTAEKLPSKGNSS